MAGAQVLVRSLPFVGRIGYVAKGPVFGHFNVPILELILQGLKHLVRQQKICMLIVQPPRIHDALEHTLLSYGYRPSSLETSPTATTQLDLSLDADELLAQMSAKTRYNIRLGLRHGVSVRQGTDTDFTTFYQLLNATGKRHRFSPESEDYLFQLWEHFAAKGHAKLFMAEYKGEVIASKLVIPFGDTVTFKRTGWSGQQGQVKPNEVLHWEVIRWAKAQGYHYIDLEGIERDAAEAILIKKPLPDACKQTPTSFKLGFGGQVVLLPKPQEYLDNSALRWLRTHIFPTLERQPGIARLLDRMRST